MTGRRNPPLRCDAIIGKVAGRVTAGDFLGKIPNHGGRYNLTAVSGDGLTAIVRGNSADIIDEKGSAARVTIADAKRATAWFM